MKALLTVPEKATEQELVIRFRARFQREFLRCLQKGFTIEEAFGMIWEETLQVVNLCSRDESILYEELVSWARRLPGPHAGRK